jgi:bifunctional DNA-binding transcriptional regulator/antitoxin component of YhaV-PrlF toxin-antitoxin module
MPKRVRGVLQESELLTWEYERISLPKSIIKVLEWKIGDIIKIDVIKAGMIHQVVIAKDESIEDDSFCQISTT